MRRPGPRVLLVEHNLLHQRRAATPGRRRPAQPDPAVLAQQPFPSPAYVEALVLAARSTRIGQRRKLPDEVLAQPLAHLAAKSLVLGREAQVHGPTVT